MLGESCSSLLIKVQMRKLIVQVEVFYTTCFLSNVFIIFTVIVFGRNSEMVPFSCRYRIEAIIVIEDFSKGFCHDAAKKNGNKGH